MEQVSSDFDNIVNDNFSWLRTNKYVLPVVALFLILYVTSARPKLPKFIEELFENPVFRLVVIAYIVYRANSDMQSAILIAALFLIVMHLINKNKAEGFAASPAQCNDNCACMKQVDADGNPVLKCGAKDEYTSDCKAMKYACVKNKGLMRPDQQLTQAQKIAAVAAATAPKSAAPLRQVMAQVSNAVVTAKPTVNPCVTSCACMKQVDADGNPVLRCGEKGELTAGCKAMKYACVKNQGLRTPEQQMTQAEKLGMVRR